MSYQLHASTYHSNNHLCVPFDTAITLFLYFMVNIISRYLLELQKNKPHNVYMHIFQTIVTNVCTCRMLQSVVLAFQDHTGNGYHLVRYEVQLQAISVHVHATRH